jgi:predicted nucleotidyltransferase/HEPN domain-containing protein
MRTDLNLPPAKQRELALVVRILFEEFEAVLARATQGWKKAGRILKVVLYGSYARGGWVDDPVGGYRSDYDILVVVSDERLTDVVDFWTVADDRLLRETSIAQTLSAPVNFIVHSLSDVNSQLERGRPFFVDIVEHGVALYEAEGSPFAAPRKLPEQQARAEAEGYFNEWFPSAEQFLIHGQDAAARGWTNKAAFELHQAAERFYHCTLLVLTLYSPKSHKLNFLRSQAEQIVPSLIEAWPREGKFERRCFELLRQAYVNARYSPHYRIDDEELSWLTERVADLQRLVGDACRARLEPNSKAE